MPHLTQKIRFHKDLTLTPCHPLYCEQERKREKDMNIGELARQTGVSIRSLRYYETKQLLSSQRGENGYRIYDQTAIERVRMIQFYLSLGLSTDEVFDVVFCSKPDDVASLCDETDLSSCPKEMDFYQEKLAEIEAHIASLEKAKIYLKQRLTRWHA
jgi:MerR family transcriptional regulator, Zn(II)-responsive regulator of zntA